MNIPLNIDWQQILLHLFNFVILIAGLYILLYKPVKNFMAQREQHYKDVDAEAQAKLATAEAVEAEYRQKLDAIEDELRQKKADADAAVSRQTAEQLKAAQAQAEKVLADARAAAVTEKERIVAAAQKEIAELAAEAAERLVTGDLDGAYGSFLNAARGDGSHGE